jgi:predicted AlkP superfamily phosphohydrolase/phosphomutase
MSKMKAIVFGLDGASFNLLNPWIDDGKLPNIKKIVESGVYSDLESCLPPVTAPNWKCYSTGRNPGELGIFWWENIDLKNKKVYFPRQRLHEHKEIWDYLGEHDYTVGVLNTPLMHPPKKVKGFLVSGGPDASENGYTYPKKIETRLKEDLNYRVNTRLVNHFKTDEAKAVDEIYQLIQSRFDAAHTLVEEYQPDFLHITIFYINTLQHYFWNNKYVEKGWRIIDRNIGEFIDDYTNIILMSDHGTNRIEQVFYINSWLEKEGYLKMKGIQRTRLLKKLGITKENMWRISQNLGILELIKRVVPKSLTSSLPTGQGTIEKEGKTHAVDWENLVAIASGQGPIYLKDENRVEELKERLENLVNPTTGKKIASKVYRKEEVYSGSFMEKAPRLILDQTPGTHVRGGLGNKEVFESTSGWMAENRRLGIFATSGPDIKKCELKEVSVLDLAPSILSLYGIPKPRGMEGRVLDCIKKTTAKRDAEKERIRRTIRRKAL